MRPIFYSLAVLLAIFAVSGCGGGTSATTAPTATPTPAPSIASSNLQSIEIGMTQAAALAAATPFNPCSSGSFGLNLQTSGLSFSMTLAPASCVLLGWTVNGNPSVSFSGSFTDSTRTAGTGTGPVGGFTLLSPTGQSVTCTIPPPGQTFTFSAGGHGSQTGGSFTCNGMTYVLPPATW